MHFPHSSMNLILFGMQSLDEAFALMVDSPALSQFSPWASAISFDSRVIIAQPISPFPLISLYPSFFSNFYPLLKDAWAIYSTLYSTSLSHSFDSQVISAQSIFPFLPYPLPDTAFFSNFCPPRKDVWPINQSILNNALSILHCLHTYICIYHVRSVPNCDLNCYMSII